MANEAVGGGGVVRGGAIQVRGATGKAVPCADRVEKRAHCGGSNGDGVPAAVAHAPAAFRREDGAPGYLLMGSSDEDSGEEEMELRPVKTTPWVWVLKDLGIDLIEKFNAAGLSVCLRPQTRVAVSIFASLFCFFSLSFR